MFRIVFIAFIAGVPVQSQDVDAWIQSLGDSSLEKRAAATEKLRADIKAALPALRKASAGSPDAQIRAAAQALVAAFAAGAVIWKYECTHGGMLIQPLRLCGESKGIVSVICGCAGGTLVGLDAATGEVRWNSNAGQGFSTSFAPAGDVILATVNTGPDKLISVDVATGKSLWTFEGKKGLHRPVLAGEQLYVGGGDGVRALDPKTGGVKWHLPSNAWVSTPSIADTLLIGSGFDGKVMAIERDSGKAAWAFPVKGRPSQSAIAGSRVLVGAENSLYALDLKSGEKSWECVVKGWQHESPVAVDGIVYCKTSYLGPKGETGGYPTLYEHTAVELATGKLVKQQAEAIEIPGRAHTWIEAKGQVSAVDAEGKPLKDGATCTAAACDGVHLLTLKSLQVGADDVKLFESKGRLRAAPNAPTGERILAMAGGFPVYSGFNYEGPRRSAVVSLRAVDADR